MANLGAWAQGGCGSKTEDSQQVVQEDSSRMASGQIQVACNVDGPCLRNVAIRAVQPAVVSIVAHRAVQLYSGQLVL